MKKITYIWICLLLIGCGKKSPVPKDVQQRNGFYYWSTSWSGVETDIAQLDSFETKVIYLRLLDIGWDGETMQPVPLGEFYSSEMLEIYDRYEVIPTVFITNETFKNIDSSEIRGLAARVYHKIINHFYQMAENSAFSETYNKYDDYDSPYRKYSDKFDELVVKDSLTRKYLGQVKEIQLDCDWTEGTREKYFEFIKEMKKKFPDKKFSCTVRLYPYKYPEKAGVPPVDKGMLMCYNVGDVTKEDAPNSIFTKKEVMKYISTKKEYPLLLDYALPIFSWTAVYRKGKLIRILDQMRGYDLSDTTTFVETPDGKGTKKFGVLKDTELQYQELQLKKHDVIKVETINYDELIEVARALSEKNTNPTPNVVLFSFNPNTLRENEKSIRQVFSSF